MSENKEFISEFIESLGCEVIIFQCPHCRDYISVKVQEINCAIFSHASYKSNNEPINPHMNKVECEELVEKGLVYGCAKPFRIIKLEEKKYKTEECDYI